MGRGGKAQTVSRMRRRGRQGGASLGGEAGAAQGQAGTRILLLGGDPFQLLELTIT